MELTTKVRDFILHIYKQKGFQITKSTQPYDTIKYYLMTGYLKKNGLLKENGFNETQKIWTFTPEGLKIAKLISEIDAILKGFETKKQKEVNAG